MAATIDKDLTSTPKAARGGKPMRFAGSFVVALKKVGALSRRFSD